MSTPTPTPATAPVSISNIPKLVHTVFYDFPKDIDLGKLASQLNLQSQNKDFTFIVWDQEKIEDLVYNFGVEHIKYFYDSQVTKNEKIKFAKLVILYCFGGVIIDPDVFIDSGLSEILGLGYDMVLTSCLSNNFIDGFFDKYNLVSDKVLMSKPKHPLILEMLVKISQVNFLVANVLLESKFLIENKHDTVSNENGNTHIILSEPVEDVSFYEYVSEYLNNLAEGGVLNGFVIASTVLTGILSFRYFLF